MPKDSKSGKGGRSNKTARVLSLLTDPDSAVEEKPKEAAEPAPEASHKSRAHSDETTQAQIHDALESELASLAPAKPVAPPVPEPVPAAPIPEPEPAPAPAPEPEPETAPEPVPAPEPAPETQSQPEPVPVPAAEPKPEPAAETAPVSETPAAPEPDDIDNYTCLNVTQSIVEEKADKYMKMFGMCTCNRCRIDVIAMALSNLPAKYVVVKNEDINPRLSFYEQKYSAAVITQVMGACKKVLERPHHKR